MQHGYRFLEHTADVGIEIRSPSLEGVYEIAGGALFDLIAKPQGGERAPRTVTSKGGEPEVLLANFLNDLLLLFEVEGLLFRELRARKMEEGRLVVDALCERLDPQRHKIETVVKAATLHDVLVEKEGDGWRARVFLDL